MVENQNNSQIEFYHNTFIQIEKNITTLTSKLKEMQKISLDEANNLVKYKGFFNNSKNVESTYNNISRNWSYIENQINKLHIYIKNLIKYFEGLNQQQTIPQAQLVQNLLSLKNNWKNILAQISQTTTYSNRTSNFAANIGSQAEIFEILIQKLNKLGSKLNSEDFQLYLQVLNHEFRQLLNKSLESPLQQNKYNEFEFDGKYRLWVEIHTFVINLFSRMKMLNKTSLKSFFSEQNLNYFYANMVSNLNGTSGENIKDKDLENAFIRIIKKLPEFDKIQSITDFNKVLAGIDINTPKSNLKVDEDLELLGRYLVYFSKLDINSIDPNKLNHKISQINSYLDRFPNLQIEKILLYQSSINSKLKNSEYDKDLKKILVYYTQAIINEIKTVTPDTK